MRQFFLTGPAGEHALLDALERIFDDASLLVTYNGRTFDVPVMETRWAFHRRRTPTDALPHFDMLPPARRLWGRAAADARTARPRLQLLADGARALGAALSPRRTTCRASRFPRAIFSSCAPATRRHRRRARAQSARPRVLAALTSHALSAGRGRARGVPRAESSSSGSAGCYERAGESRRARARVRAGGRGGRRRDVRAARARAARRAACAAARPHRRSGRAGSEILDDAAPARRPLVRHSSAARPRRSRSITSIARKDPATARRYAETLRAATVGASRGAATTSRIGSARLDRKIAPRTKTKGGQAAAPVARVGRSTSRPSDAQRYAVRRPCGSSSLPSRPWSPCSRPRPSSAPRSSACRSAS